jgi:SDR family mycofactocin-dependent oxidoreductase
VQDNRNGGEHVSLKGKVAFITGAGRGQGRSHAVRLARSGADIVAVDICSDYDTVPYPMASASDLEETVRLVEKEGSRAIGITADVRDLAALRAAVERTQSEFGGLDIVVANAGITSWIGDESDEMARRVWDDVLNTCLTGTWNTLRATVPVLILQGRGGAIVITSSTAGLKGFGGGVAGPDAYTAAKTGVVGLMRSYAAAFGQHGIRVNSVHPTGTNTMMVNNPPFQKLLSDLGDAADRFGNALPVGLIEPEDVSEAVAWLVSDEARYVTGASLPVDAGSMVL